MTTAYNVAQGKNHTGTSSESLPQRTALKTFISSSDWWWPHFFFSPSIWNFTSFLKIQCLRQHLLSQLSWPEGKKLQDHITFLFRFQGTFLRLIINTQNHNPSTFLKHFTALTYLFQISDQDNSNVRSRQTAQAANGGWQYVDLLFRFIKWLIFWSDTISICRVLQSSAWNTIQLKVGQCSPSCRHKTRPGKELRLNCVRKITRIQSKCRGSVLTQSPVSRDFSNVKIRSFT